MKNQYGLSRTIPEDIKRDVRKRCGFGCVICGSSIIDYDHFDPEFPKARFHTAVGITLLCPGCHARVTRRFISRNTVLAGNSNPYSKRTGFAFDRVECSSDQPVLRFAGFTFKNCRMPIVVRGVPVFWIELPEENGAPYRISASFYNSAGMPSLMIRRNEWRVGADSWDVEATGGSVTVRDAHRVVSLRLIFDPGVGIIVDILNMNVQGVKLSGGPDALFVAGNRISGFAVDSPVGLIIQ